MTSQALKALDHATLSWFHLKAIVVAGMGFFTDAYDLFNIGLLTRLIGRLYYDKPGSKKPGQIPIAASVFVTGSALIGASIGQLLFGYLGDRLGRKKIYGFTLLLMIVASLMSAMSFGTTPTAVVTSLIIMRFFLGIGIGGDYPLSATIMSEYSNKRFRGAFIASVFAMQGLGILTAAAFTLLIIGIFNNTYSRPPFNVAGTNSTAPEGDFAWRIIVAFAAIPTVATFYYRMKLPETARYTEIIARDSNKAARDMAKVMGTDMDPDMMVPQQDYVDYTWKTFTKKFGWMLFGTSSTWFLLDIAFYSQNLFNPTVFEAVGFSPPAAEQSALEEAYNLAKAQALVTLWSTFPGYWFTVLTVDWLGQRTIQIGGFFFMTVFMVILAADYNHITNNKAAFVSLYSLTFFFANWGPNATTFIIPAECFPAKFRSTAHGISAASGRLGAILGAFGFLFAAQNPNPAKAKPYPAGIGLQGTLGILAGINGLGLIISIFLTPETKGRSLEDLGSEINTKNVETGDLPRNGEDGRPVRPPAGPAVG